MFNTVLCERWCLSLCDPSKYYEVVCFDGCHVFNTWTLISFDHHPPFLPLFILQTWMLRTKETNRNHQGKHRPWTFSSRKGRRWFHCCIIWSHYKDYARLIRKFEWTRCSSYARSRPMTPWHSHSTKNVIVGSSRNFSHEFPSIALFIISLWNLTLRSW